MARYEVYITQMVANTGPVDNRLRGFDSPLEVRVSACSAVKTERARKSLRVRRGRRHCGIFRRHSCKVASR
jgi:hypothetical protein